jgi:hypothetical protein
MQSYLKRVREAVGTRSVAVGVAAVVLAASIGGVAIAGQSNSGGRKAGDPLVLGRSNGTGQRPIGPQTILFARNSEYALRESNLSDSGGGAIHGCRAGVPPADAGSAGPKPCLRANNLEAGQAFQFQTTKGLVGGRIQVGGANINEVNPNPNAVPFETNARGRVANLNADLLDGCELEQLRTPGNPCSVVSSNGTPGPPGPQGPQGPPGGLNNVVTRFATSDEIPVGNTGGATAQCQAGERVVGGGFTVESTNGLPSNTATMANGPSLANGNPPAQGGTATAWTAAINNAAGNDSAVVVTTYVQCAA